MNDKEIKGKIKKATSTQQRTKLKARWDEDLDRYLLKPHVMRGVHGDLKDKPLPGVYNVTSSDPQTYLDRITSIISRAEPRLRITSSLPDKQIELISNWWRGVIASANKLEVGNSATAVFPTACFYVNLRGFFASRNVIYKDGDETVFEIKPLDVYDVYWKKYRDKLAWACIYATEVDSEEAAAEYGMEVKGDTTDVYNFWDSNGTEYTCVGKETKATARDYIKEPPFIIVPVVTTPVVSGSNSDRLSMVGESLFHSARKTIDERNDILSIIKTHAMLGMRPPLAHTSDGGEARELKEYPTWGSVIEQYVEEKIDSVKFSDMSNTNAMFFNMMDGEYQRATVPQNEYGGLNFQLSSLALDTLSGQRGVVFLPRQQTLEHAYHGIFRQMFNQFIDGKFSMTMLDLAGREVEISYTDLIGLKGKFRYDFNTDVETPEQESSNYQKAVMALNAGMPMDFVVRHVFKSEDPEKILTTIADERLMAELPELRIVRAYDEAMKAAATLKGDEKEAKLTEAMLLKTRIQSLLAQLKPEQEVAGGEAYGGTTQGIE